MGIVIDIIVVLLIALSTFLGYHKGLTKVLFKIFSFFLAVILMLILYKPVSNFVITETTLDESIKSAIQENLSNTNLEDEEVIKNDEEKYPSIVVEYVNKYARQAIEEGKTNIIEYVSDKLSVVIINVIVAIGLFIVINVLLLIIEILTRFIVKLPILKQVDKTGGVIFGLVRGLAIVYVILAILSVCTAFIENNKVGKQIEESYITKYMYNNNIILKVIAK